MGNNSLTTLSGWFKESYASKVTNLIPDTVYYAREAKAVEKSAQTGGDYKHAVNLTSEQGITKAGAAAGTFSLNAPIAMASRQATLAGSNFVLRTGFDYETLTRLEGQNSFETETKPVIKNMLDSAYQYQEMDIMWGKSGVATLSAVVGAPTYTITTAEFAPGIFWGSEGRKITFFSAAGVLRGTATISTYDLEARTITLDAAIPGAAITDICFFTDGGAANEMNGLHQYMTAAGSFLGISGTSYKLWSPPTAYGVAGALSFNHIQKAIARGYKHGLGKKSKGCVVVINPDTWVSLANDEAALRQYDASFTPSKLENGAENIKFYSVAGPVEIMAHDMMKEGYGYIHPSVAKCLEKVGSRPNPTFDIPGQPEKEKYLRTLENSAGVESRCYWNMSIFSAMRSQFQLMSGIVNP
jgi:hypothetical protein